MLGPEHHGDEHDDAVGNTPVEPPVDAEVVGEAETVGEDVAGVPVLARVRTIEPASRASLPAVQAAAAAATGFLAGAATLILFRRRAARKLVRSRRPRRAVDALPVIASRSFLIDVHLIGKPGE